MKVVKFLGNRWILLKVTTKKTAGQERVFLNFLRPLMTAGLPFMESVFFTLLAKSVLIRFELSAVMSAAGVAIQKKLMDQVVFQTYLVHKSINNFKWRNGRFNEMIKSLEESGLLVKIISEIITNEAKLRKGGFLPMLFLCLAY